MVRGDVDTTQSGNSTNYSLPLFAGTWNIKAVADGYESTKAIVEAALGETTQNLGFTLIPGYTITPPEINSLNFAIGGVVSTQDGNDSLNVPPGTSGNGTISINNISNVIGDTNFDVIGDGTEMIQSVGGLPSSIATPGTSYAKKVTREQAAAANGIENVKIGVYNPIDGTWQPQDTSCIFSVQEQVYICSIAIPHYSLYGVIAPKGASQTPALHRAAFNNLTERIPLPYVVLAAGLLIAACVVMKRKKLWKK